MLLDKVLILKFAVSSIMSAIAQLSLVKQNISDDSFLKLRSLWHDTEKILGERAFLVTEKEIFLYTEQSFVINIKHDLQNEIFSLLITPQFKVLLSGLWKQSTQNYQTDITFDPTIIANYISRLKNLYQCDFNIFQYLELKFTTQIRNCYNYLQDFIDRLKKILNIEQNWQQKFFWLENKNDCCLDLGTAKKMLHYQLEQKHILDQVQNQIEQKFDLLEIIQTTIERVLMLLQVDRLVIYQLDVSLQFTDSSNTNFNTITHEAKASESIASVLNFKHESCFQKSSETYEKYRQGSSLVINDVKAATDLTPCLQTLMEKMQVKAKLVVPINLQDKLWGFLIAHQCFQTRKWHHSETKLLRDIADYIAIAISQDRSYKLLQQQKHLLEKKVKTQAKQIKDALVAAQIANQLKHEFVDNMTHEFKTPLTSIIGLSGTLIHWSSNNNKPLPVEKQQKYLKTIQASGKQLLKLVDSILEFSEVESGKHLLNITQFSLQDLFDNILPILNQEAQYKSIDLSINWQSCTPKDYIYADQDRLEEILLNIVGNGIKFTPPEGKVNLKIIKEATQIDFKIEDTGIGISKQQMPLIFHKFQQLEYSRRRTYGGVGLGLTLSKHLVELHGGNIEVESVVGQGSVFTVCLPIKNQQNQESLAPNQLNIPSKTIVLITQEEAISTLICQVLNTAEYKVVWLVDSAIAPHQLQLLEPKVIILDPSCPELDIELISEQIREIELLNKIKIVLLCDTMSTSDWKQFAQYGVHDYILKSMSFTQILNKIYTIV
jgi:two-component system sensor histidine kinase/response regulator